VRGTARIGITAAQSASSATGKGGASKRTSSRNAWVGSQGLVKRIRGVDEEIVGAALRGSMHFYALIPVVAILISAAFGAVCVVWNSDRRATAPMCAIFACTGVWALLDLMTFLETDPVRAQFWIQWMHLPALLLGPSTTWVLGQWLPQIGSRLQRLARAGFAIAVALGVAAALLPGSLEGVVETDWGNWVAQYGIVSILIVPIGTVLPLVAGYEALRVEARRQLEKADASRAHAVTVSVSISLLAAISTEYVMPLLSLPAPRLGAVAIATASAVMWLRALHASDDLLMTPEGMARSMLDELPDGVALVQLDGAILATNMRFMEMVRRRSSELMGTSIESRVETSISEICAGLEDRESILQCEEGEPLPVSLSSSIARDRDGNAIGAVVVFRDRREIDALRRRLLTSGRLAAIGELAAGIAHEVNNPIAFIRSDFNLLSQRLEEIRHHTAKASGRERDPATFERIGHRIDVALEGIERVAEVVGDVRGFAHVGGAGQGGSDPAVLIKGAMRLARLQRGDDVELRVRESDCSEWIESGQELKQVLLSLILILVAGLEKGGAVEAGLESSGDSLRITLAAERFREDQNVAIRHFEMLAGGELGASHSDLGLAIATELIDQMGATFTFDQNAPDALLISLQLPLDTGAV
jgi:signal transduction histidine kinase